MTVEEGLELKLEENRGWDERIRVARCGELVRSYLIKTERFLLVYDTLLGPQSGSWLRSQAQEFGAGLPLLVVNSHADWDHYFGNQCFPEPILGTPQCAERVQTGIGARELAQKRAEFPQDYGPVQLRPPSVLLEGGTLAGGDLTITLHKTVGHRPDHLALYIPELETLFPGDCVEDPIPLVDEDSVVGDQTVRELIDSLKWMRTLEPKWVLANHAAPEAGVARIESNLSYLRRLCEKAEEFGTLEDLEGSFPPDKGWGEFYRGAHNRQLRMAWEQRRRPG